MNEHWPSFYFGNNEKTKFPQTTGQVHLLFLCAVLNDSFLLHLLRYTVRSLKRLNVTVTS